MEIVAVRYMRMVDGRWLGQVPAHPKVRVRAHSLLEARDAIRGLLARLPGWDETRAYSVQLAEERVLPPEAKEAIARMRAATTALLVANKEADLATRKAVELLVGKLLFSFRDAAALLGLSHARVYQLTQGTQTTTLKDRRLAAARVASRKLKRRPRSG